MTDLGKELVKGERYAVYAAEGRYDGRFKEQKGSALIFTNKRREVEADNDKYRYTCWRAFIVPQDSVMLLAPLGDDDDDD